MMKRDLTWRELKGLYELYSDGCSTARIQDHPYILFLKDDKHLLEHKLGNRRVLVKKDGFDEYYTIHHLQEYRYYQEFLSRNQILHASSRYYEDDIQVMILVEANREEITSSLSTRRQFSSLFFKDKDSKHLEKHPGLERAILALLQIDHFPEQDPKNNQMRCVIDCKDKKYIVLCENLSFLKIPWKAREHSIELWFVGGNNVSKLDHVDLKANDIPLFYSCDWDYDGLRIYQIVKKYLPAIRLLVPKNVSMKPMASGNHNSLWKRDVPFSALETSFFEPDAFALIQTLVEADCWIEEESCDLIKMIEYQLNSQESKLL